MPFEIKALFNFAFKCLILQFLGIFMIKFHFYIIVQKCTYT